MELTEPLSIAVQAFAQRTLFITPMRCSLPSMLGMTPATTGLGRVSKYHSMANERTNKESITENKHQACCVLPTNRPNIETCAIGTTMMTSISQQLRKCGGFSTAWHLFT